MNFEVYPQGMYQILKKVAKLPSVPKLYVTESGVCYRDFLTDGTIIKDKDRTDYHSRLLQNALKAKLEGVPLEGYFVWSLTDNFEWKEGYQPRFGLVYIDYKNQKRYIKDSGKWFKEFLGDKLFD
jgi:beta-glucosidase